MLVVDTGGLFFTFGADGGLELLVTGGKLELLVTGVKLELLVTGGKLMVLLFGANRLVFLLLLDGELLTEVQ